MLMHLSNKPFHNGGVLLNRTLLDFWRWSASDLVSNTLRGILAEYIVASALELPQEARVEWDAFDLKTPAGLKLEVKSAAYLFGIAPTRAWDEEVGHHSQNRQRQADIYVFCFLHHQDKATVDPLDMTQWTFYLLRASVLDERLPLQRSIGPASLLKLNALQCVYEELAPAVNVLALKD